MTINTVSDLRAKIDAIESQKLILTSDVRDVGDVVEKFTGHPSRVPG
jgi:hypothetical protein